MKPIILSCDSSDILDFFDHETEDPDDFGFPLNLTIGIEGQQGADNFQLMVDTPKYI